ncbi:nucleotide exchange factor GrpE [Corynebacterium pygosceleis]|uniref:Protein GrpE n=1 Tax=Corynebacterium pygosceleis TaxID=2800406 RepID=A0A9Q4CB93_9CORY|nr:nucleotide exchange factor GrpE [Corynebacterium pygosceleis]MCK7638320.1 nucleotide exchange factor GrpE [Corynebacterium pygosceleis]MCK7675300.1 nucleotide exchange factor GrpE [Corynebacterium pygosceleis]MCL0121306.1 nucleotide exchange factor GrpE [Corynebacterium pygosceleis]MCX7445681.1 nucleotide exchange factor GrpE [Corynebacterium pygosceleis]MCX7468983.1 nucleotide exchange factor GrpE [Corynebacterium pygosceleis]
MPDNPGDPSATDPEATSPESAESAVADAKAAADADAAAEATADAELDEALATVAAEEAAADAENTGTDDTPDLSAELAERTEDLQRVTAEYANYRRRTERDRQAVIASAKASVVNQLLDVVDDLDLAERHGDLTGPLKSVNDKLRAVLTRLDVTEFGAEGDDFDAERHEAVQDLSEGDDKVIGTVLRRGFAMGDRLLRTAMVIITDPRESAPGDSGADEGDDTTE